VSLSSLRGRRVGVWGLGIEGREAVRLLRAESEIVVVDDGHGGAGPPEAAEFERISPDRIGEGDVDVIVRSPGISKYRDDVVRIERLGIETQGLTALWLEDQDPARVIAVTGTKGKSTTSAVCASLLRAAGVPSMHVGNVGVPPTQAPDDVLTVLEVSSYQAVDMRVSPRVAGLTVLGIDHLDWHGTVERYWADKVNVLAHAALEVAVIGPAVDRDAPMLAGISAGARRRHVDTDRVLRDLLPEHADGLGGFDAPHLRDDLAIAIGLASEVTMIEPTHVAEVVANYEGLPHRMQTVARAGGVTYIDDALGSNPTATVAALHASDNAPGRVLIILGGRDRGVPSTPLVEAIVERRDRVVALTMGETGRQLAPLLAAAEVEVVGPLADLDSAVRLAIAEAAPGDTVLFSPGAATAEGEGNYATRGDRFTELVLDANH